jgi:membrane protein
MFASLLKQLHTLVWDTPTAGQPVWRKTLVEAGRILWVVIRDLLSGTLSLRAMSLVYTTLLSLVPALAIAFALSRAFGLDSYVQAMLTDFLGPLGERGAEITQKITEFVSSVNANVLGTVGFAFLLYTVISMIKKVEEAFNSIWRVESNRSLTRQITEIVSMSVLGPIVVLTLIGIMAGTLSNAYVGAITSFGPIRFLIDQMSRLVPFAVLIGAFTFLYALLPNARVRFTSALVGATVAGIVWGATGWAFALFVVRSAQYVAIYSAFASLAVFMVWLYVAWLILLMGCSIAFYFQNRRYLSPIDGLGLLTSRQLDRMAVQAMLLLHESFRCGTRPWTQETLAQRLRLPVDAMKVIVQSLCRAELVIFSSDSPSRLLPGRSPEKTAITDILEAVRRYKETGDIADSSLASVPKVDAFFQRLTEAEASVLEGTSITDLIDERPTK